MVSRVMSELTQGAIDKRAVALAFSRAASTYDDLARMQYWVGSQLMKDLASFSSRIERPDTFLDLGAGTGSRTAEIQRQFSPQQVISLDIAQGMCRRIAKEGGAHPVTADFDALPLRSASIDMVYANFALQWSNNIDKLLHGIHQALRPAGVFGFTTLLEGTLPEINNAWREVDAAKKNIEFPLDCQWREAMASQFSALSWQVDTVVDTHADIKGLLSSIKGIGAANHSSERSRQTLSRGQYQKFIGALEKYAKNPQRLSSLGDAAPADLSSKAFAASYRVLRVVCQKKQAN